ncbi:hypothetical protein VTJ04DRAFT_8727 [Mycothermus thermophilus]|uniref:uncharacterized protein n=1 Tax=Humicola insolens TaxID=85995 RepID=UPI003743175D
MLATVYPTTSHHSVDLYAESQTADPFQALYNSIAKLSLTEQQQTTTAKTQDEQQQEEDLLTITPLFPPGENVIFAHSTFFRRPALPGNIYPDLPTPAQVRAEAGLMMMATDDDNSNSTHQTVMTTVFPSHELLVKHGMGVRAAEGKAMILAWKTLVDADAADAGKSGILSDGRPPVPEVFGWRKDPATGERCVYMEMPRGDVLEERWAGMTDLEREVVCAQLKGLVREWRRLRLGVGFVGSVDHGPLQDEVFRNCVAAGAPPPGPFPTVAAFHDYFVTMAATLSHRRHYGGSHHHMGVVYQPSYSAPAPPPHLFPADVPIVFTHGALHPRNIIVTQGPNPRVVAIMGWENAGWAPAYWELCKARWECSRRGRLGGGWETKYLPWILDAEGLGKHLREWSVGALCQYWDYFVGLL